MGKPALMIALGKPKDEEEEVSDDVSDDDDGDSSKEEHEAAQDIIDAIKADDASLVARALKNFNAL